MVDTERNLGTLAVPAACSLAIVVLVTAWVIAGASGLLYLLVLGIALLCGLPWGLALFGSRHAAGWLAGALFGYAGAGFLWWLVAMAGHGSWPLWVAAWLACTAASWALSRRWRRFSPMVPLASWTRADTLALVLTMALVPLLVARPFSQIGRLDEDGGRRYRAYFTADFVWHMALVEELTKHDDPPTNPYLAPEAPLLLDLFPRAVGPHDDPAPPDGGQRAGAQRAGLRPALRGHALPRCLGCRARPSVRRGALPSRSSWCAAAWKGAAALVYGWWKGWSFSYVRGLNVDALPAWAFHGLRIDNLPRALWYTPQHAAAFSLGAIASLAALGGAGIGRGAIALSGIALGLAVTLNPFVGAVFAAVYGVVIAADAIRTGTPRRIVRHLSVAVPIALALVWCAANEITAGSGSNLVFGWWGPATHAPVPTLLMSFLPAAIPAVVGVLAGRSAPETRIAPAVTGIAISVVLMFTVACGSTLTGWAFGQGT